MGVDQDIVERLLRAEAVHWHQPEVCALLRESRHNILRLRDLCNHTTLHLLDARIRLRVPRPCSGRSCGAGRAQDRRPGVTLLRPAVGS